MQRDEVYVVDIGRILVREWRWFAAGLLSVIALAFLFLHEARPQWEATAYIQIGQVAGVPPGQDPKVEPLARVLERLKWVPFENDVMASLGIAPDAPEASLYRKSLKLEPLPYAGPLVKFTVRGWSPRQARQFAEATVTQLQALHQKLLAAPLAMTQARLSEVQADLDSAQNRRSELRRGAGSAGGENTQAAGVASLLLTTTDTEILNLRQAKGDLSVRLSPNYTYETSLMWPVFVPRGPAFPNPALIGGIAVLFGLSLGAFAAIARHALRRARATPLSFNQTDGLGHLPLNDAQRGRVASTPQTSVGSQ
ncbi:lipopolysaccharide biosynthesis protein [Dyella telluris]|uniref:Lipopolysaccharide biosynthesis protein n=1 Tax=Dyella telluris TaxID=2763498 RepID=A0A7G8Q3D4_9GAMM|nr:lipopolysaccharide biosynthesis protein [Dyella telluris]QNK01292.1 lipopolysaccharide biosynthesis protein [Dyella telluris]